MTQLTDDDREVLRARRNRLQAAPIPPRGHHLSGAPESTMAILWRSDDGRL